MRLPLTPLSQLRRDLTLAEADRDSCMAQAQFCENEGDTKGAEAALAEAIACEDRMDAIREQMYRTVRPVISVAELTGRAPQSRRVETRAERHEAELRRYTERMARRHPA